MSSLLDSCYSAVNSVEEVERIDTIPGVNKKYIECWKVSTEIFVDDILTPIYLYIGFNSDFPYSLPSFYFQSSQFGYIPHMESQGGKLCLFNEGVSYKINNPKELILYCLKKAKNLVREGAEKKNFSDFIAEISSYWTRAYNDETPVDECFVICNNIPTLTKVINTIKFAIPLTSANKNMSLNTTLLYESDDEPFNSVISRSYHVIRGNAIFITSFQLPAEAPYDITFQSFLNRLTDEDEKKQVVNFVNCNNGGKIFFRLTPNKIGGILISSVNLKRNGFRNGTVKTTDVYLKFERSKTKLKRLYGSLYSRTRVAERTLGTLMPEHKYAVAGLGSIGSNLVHFLNGYNNASFTLIDNERLTIDNIGRHLLGFRYINQVKVHAVAKYLHDIRPDQEVLTKIDTIQGYLDIETDNLNRHTALFVCTGDTMTDEYIINIINQNGIKIPVFFLWLEPFGAAAHLIYINRTPDDPTISIINSDTLYYKFNLIEYSEYIKIDNQFTKKDAGCNGSYTLYSGNDVLEMLCAFYPIMGRLLSNPEKSKCYRWIGNIEEIVKRGITCKDNTESLRKGLIQEFPI